MSKKTNTKKCNRGCNTDIYLSDETGKWLPYNLDNSPHKCIVQEHDPSPSELSERKNNNIQNNEVKLAHIIESIQQVLKELQSLK
jgi:hypothetical protein